MSIVLHSSQARSVRITIAGAEIHAVLMVPDDAHGLVAFAHATGNCRSSPRNQQLAGILDDAGLATLVCDLLTAEEEMLSEITGEFRFDAMLMSRRLAAVVDWCAAQPGLRNLPVGLMGTGIGGAVALIAAAGLKERIRAIVVRGGRLDLAWSHLPLVETPTLLIAGEFDMPLRIAYSVAMPRLQAIEKQLLVVPRAGQLFQESEAREQLGRHAADWFQRHFGLMEAGHA